MHNLKAIRIFILIAAGGLVLPAVLAGLFILRLPEADQLIPPGSTGLIVTITGPQNGATFPAGQFLTVTARAFGSGPVSALQLWVDGVMLETKNPADPAQPGAYWAWTPPSPGEHVLVVGATGVDGGSSAYSNPVRIFVMDTTAASLAPYSAQAGETLAQVADQFILPLDSLVSANPGIDPFEPLSPNQPISIPNLLVPPAGAIPPPGPSSDLPAGAALEPPSAAPSNLSLWLDINVRAPRNSTAQLPAAPTLFRFAEGCDVHWYIRDNSKNELGFFVYRLGPADSDFTRIATLGPHTGSAFIEYIDTGLYGNYQYYVSAFNAFGESNSNLSGLAVSAGECKPPAPPGFILEGFEISPNQPVDKMYCYLSGGGDLWSRVPAGDGRFVFPIAGVFDFTRSIGLLPAEESMSSLECWGWRGGSLIELGTATGSPPAGDGSINFASPGFGVSGRLKAVDLLVTPLGVLDGPPPPAPNINRPVNLTRTSALKTCVDHFPDGFGKGFLGPLLCSKAIPNGDLILVWDWSYCPFIFPVEGSKITCADYLAEINGYKIYKSLPGKSPALVGTISNRDQTIFFFPGGDPGSPPPTFFVRAYAGPFESANSNPYVLAGVSSGTETVTILPIPFSENELSYFSDWTQKVVDDCDIDEMRGTGSEGDMGLGTDEIVVGFDHSVYDCVELNDIYWRASLLFDISAVKGPVSSAVLKYKQGKTVSGGSDGYGADGQSCAEALNISTGVSTAGITSFDPYRALSATGYPGYVHSVHVTEAIRDWMLGAPNVGFLFTGRDEGFPEENYACWSRYKDFVLTVTYFK